MHQNRAHVVKETSNEKDQHGSDTVTEKVARLKLTIGLELGDRSSWYCVLPLDLLQSLLAAYLSLLESRRNSLSA